jgi:hypothetical protein
MSPIWPTASLGGNLSLWPAPDCGMHRDQFRRPNACRSELSGRQKKPPGDHRSTSFSSPRSRTSPSASVL